LRSDWAANRYRALSDRWQVQEKRPVHRDVFPYRKQDWMLIHPRLLRSLPLSCGVSTLQAFRLSCAALLESVRMTRGTIKMKVVLSRTYSMRLLIWQ
jgi:hypothetical protein